jgi:hypothetical protein
VDLWYKSFYKNKIVKGTFPEMSHAPASPAVRVDGAGFQTLGTIFLALALEVVCSACSIGHRVTGTPRAHAEGRLLESEFKNTGWKPVDWFAAGITYRTDAGEHQVLVGSTRGTEVWRFHSVYCVVRRRLAPGDRTPLLVKAERSAGEHALPSSGTAREHSSFRKLCASTSERDSHRNEPKNPSDRAESRSSTRETRRIPGDTET